MVKDRVPPRSEGLKAARLLMVLSSISPLFLLWALRGNSLVGDRVFIPVCLLMVILPNAFLWLRIRTAIKRRDQREIHVGSADDHRDHVLVYLFAMLLPFYSEDLGNWRYLSAAFAALMFIVFLFWHLNLHYMNLFFAARGYHVFTISAPIDGNPFSGKGRLALITRRAELSPGERVVASRISNTVYFEE